MIILDAQIPAGPLASKWDNQRRNQRLVSPANKGKYHVLVVGTGLAGASAAASLAELGYNVSSFCLQDSPRRAHSIAAQGGINAAKNYANDNDSVYRLFHDTIKGGDFRSREANVYRLAQVSSAIIDQCAAQGVPFARDYGGALETRSFGGAQVSRTFYARGQTGQQLLIGAYSALMRQVHTGQIKLFPRREMMDLVVEGGRACGIVVRNLVTGQLETYAGDAVILATGGYTNVFELSTNALSCNVSALWAAYKQGACFANPCFTQIHPTCIPRSGPHQSKLVLMSESLRNDGRIWVPRKAGDKRPPNAIQGADRYYYLEEKYPAFGNLVPRDVASRNAKTMVDQGLGVGSSGHAVYLDFAEAIARQGESVIREKYGNLFEMYQRITAENPYAQPMRIYPAPHYAMGGLWVDYNLMTTLPGLFALGEANFSDHGANRLGASALMQGLADGYFIAPYTISGYLAGLKPGTGKAPATDTPAFQATLATVSQKMAKLTGVNGQVPASQFHRELGLLMWDLCGMSREEAGLKQALTKIPDIRERFWKQVRVPGSTENFNQTFEYTRRVADYLEFAELLVKDALERRESCGCHLRVESQTPEGEAKRDDEHFRHVAAWEYQGEGKAPVRHQEPLEFETVQLAARSYK
jgi:succinate dehydrogenase / fumarate reductase flavoprotein subunit